MENRKRHAFFNRLWKKVTTFFKTKDVVTFLLFLFLASVLWLMHSTSNRRAMRTTAIIEYVGVPQNIMLKEALPKKIEYMVRDDNKQLWNYFSYSFDTLTVDLSRQFSTPGNKIEIEYETHLHKMIAQFSPTSKIVELSPSIFATTYTTLHTKTVAVELGNRIRLNPQYVLYDSIQIIPPTIEIIGSQGALDSIESVKLQPINETFTKSQSVRCDIALPKGVRAATSTVSVMVPVEMSTEKRMTLPITAINTPEGVNIKTFPSEVDVVFNVGLSRYNQIDGNDLQVVIDYNDLIPNSSAQALKVNYKPADINNVRMTPKSVEYIIVGSTNCPLIK